MSRGAVRRRRTKPDHEPDTVPCDGCKCDIIDVAGVGFWRVLVTPPGQPPGQLQMFCLPCITTLALNGLRLTPPGIEQGATTAAALVTSLRREWKL